MEKAKLGRTLGHLSFPKSGKAFLVGQIQGARVGLYPNKATGGYNVVEFVWGKGVVTSRLLSLKS